MGAGASSIEWVVEKEGRTWKDTETEDSKKFNGILFECKSVQYIVFSVCHHIVLFWSCFCAIHPPTPFFLCYFVDILHTKSWVELNLTARFIIMKMLSNLKELCNLEFHPHKLDFRRFFLQIIIYNPFDLLSCPSFHTYPILLWLVDFLGIIHRWKIPYAYPYLRYSLQVEIMIISVPMLLVLLFVSLIVRPVIVHSCKSITKSCAINECLNSSTH